MNSWGFLGGTGRSQSAMNLRGSHVWKSLGFLDDYVMFYVFITLFRKFWLLTDEPRKDVCRLWFHGIGSCHNRDVSCSRLVYTTMDLKCRVTFFTQASWSSLGGCTISRCKSYSFTGGKMGWSQTGKTFVSRCHSIKPFFVATDRPWFRAWRTWISTGFWVAKKANRDGSNGLKVVLKPLDATT